MKQLLCLLSVLLLIGACSNNRRLELALQFAGDNRHELEKVLEHYEDEPEKFAAARFLIENMPRWYGYQGWQLDSIQQVLMDGYTNGHIPRDVIDKWNEVSFFSLPKVYDSHVITAGYLIENIELAFEVWKKYPWNRSLGFDDFCELILPYRIADEQLTDWRRMYHDYYTAILDSAYQGEDVIQACRAVDADLTRVYYRWNTEFDMPHQNADFLFKYRYGYCREVCDITLYAMRACGIPVATELFVYSPEYQQFHTWTTLRDTTGQFMQFGFNEFEAVRGEQKNDGRKRGKIYRYCFGAQKEPFEGITADPQVPALFRNRFIKDVTAYYTGSNSVTIPLSPADDKYVYLAIFNPPGWEPIDITRNERGKATFRNIEPDLIYQPLYAGPAGPRPAGYPFVFTEGEAHMLIPDADSMQEAVLTRKMPIIVSYQDIMNRNMIGAKIEGADNVAFNHAQLLFDIPLFDIKDSVWNNYNPVYLQKPTVCRYVRYMAPPGKYIELAELTLYADSACLQPVPTEILNDADSFPDIGKVTDGNTFSYYYSPDSNSVIQFDLQKPTELKSLAFSPRNDDNFISPGDVYELFYQNGVQGWSSLGKKTATERTIEYLVPHNALLWLRNLTKGREEQVFVYKEEKQFFAFDIHGWSP